MLALFMVQEAQFVDSGHIRIHRIDNFLRYGYMEKRVCEFYQQWEMNLFMSS